MSMKYQLKMAYLKKTFISISNITNICQSARDIPFLHFNTRTKFNEKVRVRLMSHAFGPLEGFTQTV